MAEGDMVFTIPVQAGIVVEAKHHTQGERIILTTYTVTAPPGARSWMVRALLNALKAATVADLLDYARTEVTDIARSEARRG